MLPAVILSAKVTIDGISPAMTKLAAYQKSWEKVAVSAEVAGAAVEQTENKISSLRAQTSVPIVQEIRVDVDDQGFEDFAIKKTIAEDPVTTRLQAEVVDKGFEDFGIKKSIAEEEVVSKLRVDVEGVVEARRDLDALRAMASVPIVQKVIIETEEGGGGSTKGFTTASLTRDMTQLRTWERGHPNFFARTGGSGTSRAAELMAGSGDRGGGGFLAGALAGSMGGGGGGGGLAPMFWGHGAGGGRFGPWWGRALLGGGALAGAGTVGSFAGFGAEHFLLTMLGLAGSAGAGALGGGLVGLGAAGQMAVGGGSDLAVMKSTIADTKSLGKSLEGVTEAQWKYGAASKQAHEATAALNHEMMLLGNTAGVKAEVKLAKSAQSLNHLFDIKTGKARVQAVNISEQAVGLGRDFVPKIGHAATMNLSIINKELKPLFKWLEGPEGVGIWQILEHRFKEDLPTAVHATDQALELVLKTTKVASQYTGGFVELLDKFFTKWNEPGNFSKWEGTIGNLVHDFHLWLTLIKEAGRDVYGLFSNDAHTGNAIVISLTEMLKKVGEWERSTKGSAEIHNIFVIHKEEILALLSIIPPLVRIFKTVYMTVAPPLVKAATAILKVFAEFLELIANSGSLGRWVIGLTALGLKFGWLQTMIGKLKIGSFIQRELLGIPPAVSQVEASNQSLIASNEALVVSNDALATSFQAVQDSAIAASATPVFGAARSSASAAENMTQTFPEAGAVAAGGQMSLLGSAPSNQVKLLELGGAAGTTAAISEEVDKAAVEAGTKSGAGMAMSMSRGFADQIGIAFAAYGVINLVTSLLSHGKHHMEEAGFELGGSLVGGIAGFLVGGPLGAAVGVGLGSLGGELISKLFQHDTKHPLAERIQEEMKLFRATSKGLSGADANLRSAEKQTDAARKKTKSSTHGVEVAQGHLTTAVKKYGPISLAAHKAEIELAKAREQNRHASDHLRASETLTHNRQVVDRIRSREEIVQGKLLNQTLGEKIGRLREEVAEAPHNVTLREKLAEVEEKQIRTTEKIKSAFETLHTLAPKQAEDLHNISEAQLKWGKHLRGLIGLLPEVGKHTTASLRESNSAIKLNGSEWLTWHGVVHTQMGLATNDVNNFKKNTLSGMGIIISNMNQDLGKLGVTKVNFHAGSEKKQGGGMVVPGIGTGDKVPLTAMVEPGEVVHVLNRNASKKLGQLESLNREVPRHGFEKGGYMYPFGSGISWGRIDEGQDMAGSGPIAAIGDARIAGQGQPGWPGTNQGFFYELLNGPRAHEFIYVYENILRKAAIGSNVKAGQEIAQLLPAFPHLEMGFSTGSGAPTAQGYYTEGMETQPGKEMHAFLMALEKGGGNALFGMPKGSSAFGSAVPKLPNVNLSGPSGELKSLGQSSLDHLLKAAQHYLSQHAGSGGTTAGLGSVPTGPIQMMAKTMVERLWPKQNQWKPFTEVEMEEAGWDPHALYPGGTAYGLAANLYPETYPPAGRPGSKAPILVQAKAQLEWMMKYIKGRYGNPAGAQAHEEAYHWYQKGGTLTPYGDKKTPYDPIKKIVKESLSKKPAQHLAAQRQIKRLQHHIEGIGIKGKQLEKLVGLTGNVEKYDEFASNAASLNHTNETTGVITEGKFNGRDEGAWLNEKLTALGSLRRQLVKAHEIIGAKQAHVHKMYKEAKHRLTEIEAAIRKANLQKHVLEKKIKDIELAQHHNVQQLEKEQKALETELTKKENLKQTQAVHNTVVALRQEIKGKTEAISSTNKVGSESLKGTKESIHSLETANVQRARAESSLNELIPSLENQDKQLNETATGIFTSGGSTNAGGFWGLQTVQGKGGNLKPLPTKPPLGSVGGEIFQTELRLQQLGEELAPKASESPTSASTEEALQLQKELNLELQKNYLTSQAQYKVFQGFPSVAEATRLPFAGNYATGGLVAASVGENGAEIALMPTGSNIVSNAERRNIVNGSTGGPTTLVIEELTVYEDGSVTVSTGGQTLEAKVERITRKQSTPRRTPGGKHR